MTTTRLNAEHETEEQGSSLSQLHVDAKALVQDDLRAKTEVDTRTPATSASKTIDIARPSRPLENQADLSTLTSSQSALREQLRAHPTGGARSLRAREEALRARLQRLQERPTFVAQVKESSARNKRNPSKPFGVFTNPAYKYRGGVFSRLITFFANILKVLEALILRRFSPSKTAQRKQVIVKVPEPENSHNAQKQKDAQKEREKKRMIIRGPHSSSR